MLFYDVTVGGAVALYSFLFYLLITSHRPWSEKTGDACVHIHLGSIVDAGLTLI